MDEACHQLAWAGINVLGQLNYETFYNGRDLHNELADMNITGSTLREHILDEIRIKNLYHTRSHTLPRR